MTSLLIQKALNTGPLIYPALQIDRQVLPILLKKWDSERLSNLEDLPEGTQLDEWLQTKGSVLWVAGIVEFRAIGSL